MIEVLLKLVLKRAAMRGDQTQKGFAHRDRKLDTP